MRKRRKIGLLGGSFDPAHEGHVHITRQALVRFALDEVWWVMSPGNPLKPTPPADFDRRMAHARSIMRHPKVRISDFERQNGSRYTAETLRLLMAKHRDVDFVWLMGADNMAGLHDWQEWRWIMDNVPVGVLARPGQRISARMSMAARLYRHARIKARHSRLLSHQVAPAWCYVNVPLSKISSTKIRAAGDWKR